MTAMTQSNISIAHRENHPVITASLVFLFWVVAAVLVTGAHVMIDSRSPEGGAFATIAALIATAWLYTRLCAHDAGVPHALGVGIAWLSLSIATEVVLTTWAGHSWFTLLGSPDQAFLRNLYLFVWIFAPSIFAHREAN